MKSRVVCFAFVLPPLIGCTLPSGPISPYGRPTTILPLSQPKVSGEMIAVTRDSIWLLRDSTLLAFAGEQVREVRVQRHRFTGSRTMIWMAIAGAATASALTVSCARFESSPDGSGDSCAPVFPAVLAVFALTGGLFALLNTSSSTFYFSPADVERLRPYARFPQGIPDSLAQRLRP